MASQKTDPDVHVSSNEGSSSSFRSSELVEGDYGSDGNHVFADPKVAEYWRDVYEKAQYEGRHRFDPEITWSADEEKKLKRKVRQSSAEDPDACSCVRRLTGES